MADPRALGNSSTLAERLGRFCLSAVAVFAAATAGPASPKPEKLATAWQYPTPRELPQAILPDRLGRKILHVALKNGGLVLLDLSNPSAAPTPLARVGTTDLKGLDVTHLVQQKELLYLALGDFFDAKGSPAGLAIVSVADPRQPKVLSVWTSKEKLRGAAAILVRDRYAYLGAMKHGVFVLDVGDPIRIRSIASIVPDPDFPRKNPTEVQHPNARGLALEGQFLFVAYDAGGLRVVDVSDPLKPREVARYINRRMAGKQQAYNNLVIDGNTAYAAVDYAGMEVLDIRDPRRIRQIAWWNPWRADTLKNLWFNSPGHTNQIDYDAKRRRVYLSGGDSELLVLDVSRLDAPRLDACYGEPRDRFGTWGLSLSPNSVYLAYISSVVPFHGTWSGIKAVRR